MPIYHLNRRLFLATGASVMAGAAFARDNPMPETLRRALERDPTAPVLGNPKGNITLTEFFDYNCPYCRKVVPMIHKLVEQDPQLRIVFREWPVFGEGSDFAARAALASLQQGKYWQMHAALMQTRGPVTEASARATAGRVGLDMARLERDMNGKAVTDHINNSIDLADHMGLIGTPTFIAGDEAVFGEQDLTDLTDLIKRARATLGV